MKKEFLFGLVTTLLVLAAIIYAPTPESVHAQSSPFTFLSLQTSLSGCQWPQGDSQGVAVCPVETNGAVNVAFAANGGAFTLVGQGEQGPPGPPGATGATGPQGPPGTMPQNFTETCKAGKGTIALGFTSPGCTAH